MLIIPLSVHYLRSESKRLDASSVGLRRSEIDGHFTYLYGMGFLHFFRRYCMPSGQAGVDAGGLMGKFFKPRF